ncbi:MAG: hypothetical protein Q8N77_00520 [Nanoarchaeota archaeon]|nr:hypothetical protein [Nanoarchaeota archaeon]
MKGIKRAAEKLKYHIIDSTACLAEASPVFSAFEVGVAGLSDATSINARLLAAGMFYAGFGYLFTKGRDLSRKIFGITDKTKEKIQHAHDAAYAGILTLVTSPPIYAVSQAIAGEDIDLTKIAIGTATATLLGAANGGPVGYAVDVFRDLSGIKECNRTSYPSFLKKQSSKVKKGILAGMIAASIGLMGLVYSLTPDEKHKASYHEKQTVEQRVDASNYKAPDKTLEYLV